MEVTADRSFLKPICCAVCPARSPDPQFTSDCEDDGLWTTLSPGRAAGLAADDNLLVLNNKQTTNLHFLCATLIPVISSPAQTLGRPAAPQNGGTGGIVTNPLTDCDEEQACAVLSSSGLVRLERPRRDKRLL